MRSMKLDKVALTLEIESMNTPTHHHRRGMRTIPGIRTELGSQECHWVLELVLLAWLYRLSAAAVVLLPPMIKINNVGR